MRKKAARRACPYTTFSSVNIGDSRQFFMSDPTPARHLLIVWHSRTGTSRQLAHAAFEGARAVLQELSADEQVGVLLQTADETGDADLLKADAYLFCAPENLGALSGAMKEFFDRHYYAVLDRISGRPYGLLIAAGSDGSGAVRQAERICTGWRLRAVAPAHIVNTDAQSAQAILAEKKLAEHQLEPARVMGGTLAALLA